jgi:hypothetical protein
MTEGFRTLTDGIMSSARGRQQAIAELAAHSHQVLSDCAAKRCDMAEDMDRAANNLRRLLRDGDENRLESSLRTQGQTADRVAELAAGTRRFLRDCNDKRRAVENEVRHETKVLRQHLADGNNTRLEAFDQMHQRVTSQVAGLAWEVKCRLNERHIDSLGARAIWNELAMTRSAARKTTGREPAKSRKGHS